MKIADILEGGQAWYQILGVKNYLTTKKKTKQNTKRSQFLSAFNSMAQLIKASIVFNFNLNR